MTPASEEEDPSERAHTDNNSIHFRSFLPHEPLPIESLGYLHIQCAFEPKKQRQRKSTEESNEISNASNEYYWKAATMLEQALFQSLSNNDLWKNTIQSVHVLDQRPPFTKARLILDSPTSARQVLWDWRRRKVSPSDLFEHMQNDDKINDATTPRFVFSTRPIQATQITTTNSPPRDISWPRSNPPKFRRLLLTPSLPSVSAEQQHEILQQERDTTRFVFVTGLIDTTTICDNDNDVQDPHVCVVDAIRTVMNVYDTSGLGVEVFLPSNKKQTKLHHYDYCHVGMRSNADVKRVISNLQGRVVTWNLGDASRNDNAVVSSLQTGKLFLDYAGITPRSYARKEQGTDIVGEPSRSECTSTTDSITVPGLILIPEFVSSEEEEVLMATLTGPQAPWAPSQSTKSNMNGGLKRRVQHYGYVFDYETANVLRDRTKQGANCPPMPALDIDDDDPFAFEEFVASAAEQGKGWDVLAGIVERARRFDFSNTSSSNEKEGVDDSAMPMTANVSAHDDVHSNGGKNSIAAPLLHFPNLNQMTVNEYAPGQGIGSHIDTPSAFGDGLLSLSLNGGVVMEFRQKTNEIAEKPIRQQRKLVYLPPRSLLLMSGPARYEWEHMIVSRRTDTHKGAVLARTLRVSLTLRTALELPSLSSSSSVVGPLPLVESNVFPPKWGILPSSNPYVPNSSNMTSTALATPATEREHVHAVYDAIATQWHHTRGKRGVLWPGATQFLTNLPVGSVVADVGCGDGKYFPAIWEAGSFVIGTDISLPLLQTAVGATSACYNDDNVPESRQVSESRRHLQGRPPVVVADCMSVPLRTDSCDAAICIAVMHHLSTVERRIRCIEELSRIVKVGGTINIQAWAMEQEEGSRRKFASTDVFVPFNAQPKYLDKVNSVKDYPKGNEIAAKESSAAKSVAQMYSEAYDGAEFDERKGLVVFKRYCHLYRKGELEELASQVAGVAVSESGYESGNYFVILTVVNEDVTTKQND